MAQSNLAYSQTQPTREFDAQPIAAPRPRLRAIEGQGRGVAPQAQPLAWLRTLAVMSTLVVVVLATASIARISIANATVQMMHGSEQTRIAIESARSAGLELEVRHSLMNNPTRIQDAAAALGIFPANQPEIVSALSGFTPQTKEQMQQAAQDAHALALAGLSNNGETAETGAEDTNSAEEAGTEDTDSAAEAGAEDTDLDAGVDAEDTGNGQ